MSNTKSTIMWACVSWAKRACFPYYWYVLHEERPDPPYLPLDWVVLLHRHSEAVVYCGDNPSIEWSGFQNSWPSCLHLTGLTTRSCTEEQRLWRCLFLSRVPKHGRGSIHVRRSECRRNWTWTLPRLHPVVSSPPVPELPCRRWCYWYPTQHWCCFQYVVKFSVEWLLQSLPMGFLDDNVAHHAACFGTRRLPNFPRERRFLPASYKPAVSRGTSFLC